MNSRPVQPTQHTSADNESLLSARSLVYSYGTNQALKGVTVAVEQGEILAITGPSGSGKSTLMMCLAGLLQPIAGEVRYANQTISDYNEAKRSRLRRSEFGILFQFGQLVPELTSIENVMLPLLLSGVKRKPARSAAFNWLDRFGVADLAGSRPTEVSGGQTQRVAMARAMVTEPLVLFADEPTGALDELAGEQVMTQVVRVARESGTTVVLITHDATVAAYGTRELVIKDGMVESPLGALR